MPHHNFTLAISQAPDFATIFGVNCDCVALIWEARSEALTRVCPSMRNQDEDFAQTVRLGPGKAYEWGAASADARLAWRIGRFHPRWRDAVETLARQSPIIADLAESFPALLFALASGYGVPPARSVAFRRLSAGAPLGLVAEGLGLAWWTRKLPAGALKDPLPVFPSDADFSRRMVNLIPRDVTQCATWLTLVSEAVLAGGRQYVLWAARHGIALSGTLVEPQRQLLHAWVWMGWHPGTMGSALIRRPWSADLGIKRVLDEFGVFVQRVAIADAMGTGRAPPLVQDAIVDGYTFHTLRTAFEFISAADRLDNCLEQYGERLSRGTCSVALIQEAGVAIACVEIGPHPIETAMPAIVQLRAAKNKRASAAVWRAAYGWLSRSEIRPISADALAPTAADRIETRQRLWGGFLADLAASPGGSATEERARYALMATPPYAELHLGGPGLLTGRAVFGRATLPRRYDTSLLQRLTNLLPRPG